MKLFLRSKTTNAGISNGSYPLEITDGGGEYSIVVQIENAELFAKYNPIFQRNGYSGNGYCWEGYITQILRKIDKGLLKHIDFDPEADAFFAYADSNGAQQKFVSIVSPIFSALQKTGGIHQVS